ncbi:hypothetical protein [Microbacterium kyungheense]|uniref:Uncharacterized protein n=1 Tax=Microbacterium kyungheense TaxID=1263636 RepID=A0A543FLQ1_9MICO|nr:hypothetical protein [Microbacterium kyungheense]TQM34789.1 hypothetical protein FB391_1079 [Microbacterium kyungheense]
MTADAPTADDTAELRARLDALEAENARLRATTVTDAPAPPDERLKGSRWRAFFSALCIVIATILVPVSIVGAWARSELVDEETFVATLAPLAEDPHVQDLIISEAMDAVDAQVDFTELTGNVIDGISDLGLGPRAAAALKLLQQPAADGLHNLVQTGVTRVVESDAFADVWATAVRGAHRALVTTATSDGAGVFVLTDEGLGMKLGPIIDQVKQKLVDSGVGVASLIPAVDKTIIIGDGQAVSTIRTVYAIADVAGWWLPFVTIGLFVAGILIARRRPVAVLGTGIGLFVGGAALASTFSVGSLIAGNAAAQLDLSVSAVDVIYAALVDDMRRTALVVALLGVLVAVIGWVTGRWKPARRVRGLVGGLNASARTALAARGLDTGRFGSWLGRQRLLVRIVVVVLAVIWLMALRPLSAGDVFLVVIVALVVAWLLELLQKRPDDAARAAASHRATDEVEADAVAPTVAGSDAAAAEGADDTLPLTAPDAETLPLPDLKPAASGSDGGDEGTAPRSPRKK